MSRTRRRQACSCSATSGQRTHEPGRRRDDGTAGGPACAHLVPPRRVRAGVTVWLRFTHVGERSTLAPLSSR